MLVLSVCPDCCCMMHSLAIPVRPPWLSYRVHTLPSTQFLGSTCVLCPLLQYICTVALFILPFRLAYCVYWGRTLCVSGDLSEVASPTGGGLRS
jgi:hypothetical protein